MRTHGQIVVMSSYSGEVGIAYRTAYCASKFAVTGFFESLRMETKGDIDITIICPVTIETSFREHSLLKNTEVTEGAAEERRRCDSGEHWQEGEEGILSHDPMDINLY